MSLEHLNIVMVIARYPPIIGGTELQCRELSNTLTQRGHHVSVLTEQTSSSLPAHETQNGVEVCRFKVGSIPVLSGFLFGWHLRRWLKKHPETDVIHAHMLAGPALAAFYYGHRFKKPVVLKIAGAGVTGDIGTSQQRLLGNLKLALFKKWARWVICPSIRTYEEVHTLGIPVDYLRVIPNGVRTDRFKPLGPAEKNALRTSLGLTSKNRVALYVGRWANGKRLEMLISAWESAKALKNFGWTLLLVVNQPPPPEQQKRIDAIGDTVQVVVDSKDPLPYYKTADLAILLSENEGISNFLLEAMASGLPLVTSYGAAVSTPERSQAWSWLFNGKAIEVVTLLQSLHLDTSLLQSKGAAARLEAQESFSSDSMAKKIEELYREVLK